MSSKLLLAKYKTNSGWLFDKVLVLRWVTMMEFQDNTYLLKLPHAKVYALLTQVVHQPINVM